MKKLLFLLSFVLISMTSNAQDVVVIKHTNYTTHYSKSKMYPVMVEWWLTKSMITCPTPLKRKDKTFTLVASRSHKSPETTAYVQEMKEKHGDINLISRGSSLKLCMVAEGQADCYPRFAPTMEWDTAAGHAICNAVGLKVMQTNSADELQYNKQHLHKIQCIIILKGN